MSVLSCWCCSSCAKEYVAVAVHCTMHRQLGYTLRSAQLIVENGSGRRLRGPKAATVILVAAASCELLQ